MRFTRFKMRLAGTMVLAVALVGGPALSAQAAPGNNKQQFFLNSPEGSNKTTVTATGVFNGVGKDVAVNETFEEGDNGKFTFTGEDKFVFKQGKLFLSLEGKGRFKFDEANCSGRGEGQGSYDITGGTGIFEGAKGGGHFTFDFAFAGKQTEDGCKEENSSGVFFAKLMGNLKLHGAMAA